MPQRRCYRNLMGWSDRWLRFGGSSTVAWTRNSSIAWPRDMREGTVVLAGPQTDADPSLAGSPRVVLLGEVPFADLPGLAQQASVLIMPYADLPVTRAMQPLKLKEYLATGKPVVVRDLPANRVWADALDVVRTAEEFSETVRRRIAGGLPPAQLAARCRLQEETWAGKAQAFEQMALL